MIMYSREILRGEISTEKRERRKRESESEEAMIEEVELLGRV